MSSLSRTLSGPHADGCSTALPRHFTPQGRGAAARIKNLEQEVKSLRAELRTATIKRTQAEEALGAAKREQAALQRRLGAAADAKGKWAEDVKRSMEEQLALAKAAHDSLAARVAQERGGKEKLASDLEEAQRVIKRLREHVESRGEALKEARAQLRAKEQELQDARKKAALASVSASSAAPVGPRAFVPPAPSTRAGATAVSSHHQHHHRALAGAAAPAPAPALGAGAGPTNGVGRSSVALPSSRGAPGFPPPQPEEVGGANDTDACLLAFRPRIPPPQQRLQSPGGGRGRNKAAVAAVPSSSAAVEAAGRPGHGQGGVGPQPQPQRPQHR